MCKIAILQFCATFNCWNVRLSRFPSPWIKGSPKTKDCYISYARGGVGQGVFGLTTENHSMASSNTSYILVYICTTTLVYNCTTKLMHDNTSDGEWVGLPSCVWTTSRFQQTQHWRQHCIQYFELQLIQGEALGPALSPNRKRLLFFHLDQGGVDHCSTLTPVSSTGADGGSKGGGGASAGLEDWVKMGAGVEALRTFYFFLLNPPATYCHPAILNLHQSTKGWMISPNNYVWCRIKVRYFHKTKHCYHSSSETLSSY